MEKAEYTLSCPCCGSDKLIKDGWQLEKQRYCCKACKKKTTYPVIDRELTSALVGYKKQTQRFMDTSRIERKAFREYARLCNAVEAYNIAIRENLQGSCADLKKVCIPHRPDTRAPEGMINLSDLHLNELVELPFNVYDFQVGANRLSKLADRARQYFKSFGVTDILIVNTGDTINSDRRLDELLNQATNRANATILSVHLLRQFIEDLNKSFNVRIATVSGNEARTNQETGFSSIMATDNYDFTIMNFLGYLFEGCEGIRVLPNREKEMVVQVAGKYNVLLLHGEDLSGDIEKRIIQIMGRYSARNIQVRYVIFGHYHSARIGDLYARGSSLIGANAYSEYGLHLLGRASQNIFLCHADGGIDGIKVDLQDTDGQGYSMVDRLKEYNAKSARKNYKPLTIFEVVV